MRPSAAPHIAEIMDVLPEKQVASVIRIIRDPGRDIGLNILSQFRYSRSDLDGGDSSGCAREVVGAERRDRKE